MVEKTSSKRRGLQMFTKSDARAFGETPMTRSVQRDEALDVEREQAGASGFGVVKMLYGDPEGAHLSGYEEDGGYSLLWVRFPSNYPLGRHSHSSDCLYYVQEGQVRLGNRTLGPGEGFFAPANAPYSYTAGPDGVTLLEFRSQSWFDTRLHETAPGYARIGQSVRRYGEAWAEEQEAHRDHPS